MKYRLQDLIDIKHFQDLQDRLSEICPFTSAILDNESNILTAAAWQDVCTKFHRKNGESEKHCIKSDQYIRDHLEEADPAVTYRCHNGLVDSAVPIIIDGVHYGNFFTGQFFFEPPDLNYFRKQAKKYGFDEEAYLEAVKKVPIWNEEQLKRYHSFIKELIKTISESGLKTLREIEARRRSEEDESRLKSISDNLVGGMIYQVIVQPDGARKITYLSDAVRELYGISPEEGMADATILYNKVHEDDIGALNKAEEDAARTLSTFKIEVRVRAPSGEVRWSSFISTPRLLEDGTVCFDGIEFVITERKRLEDDLRNKEKKLREVQEMAQLGYWYWDINTGAVEWSDEVYKIFRLDPKGFTPHIDSILALSPWPEDHERDKELIRRAIESREKGVYEQRFFRPDKSIGYYYSTFQGHYDEKGNLISIVGTVMDITERKNAEGAIRRQTDRLRKLHEIDQSILQAVESTEMIIRSAMKHFHDLLRCKYAGVAIIGSDWRSINVYSLVAGREMGLETGKGLDEKTLADLIQLKEKGVEALENVAGVASLHGITRIFQTENISSLIIAPLCSAHDLIGILVVGWKSPGAIAPQETEIVGEIAGQITIAIEQARLRQEAKLYSEELERRVAERTAQLEAANKELEAFSYSVSHDLRAPLRAVDGYTRILVEDHESCLDANGRKLCASIKESARKMGELIDDLLALSRLGKVEIRYSDIDMEELAHLVFSEVTTSKNRQAIDFSVGSLPHATGDRGLIRQVWTNLLSNAVKFSGKKERPLIEVWAQENEDGVVYVVRDNGAGFDMGYAGKLFGVFQRLHSSGDFEGTGVGLAIVQRIINRHGGSVWAESEIDKGATFYFKLKKCANN